MKTLTTILTSALIVFSIPLHAADKKEKVVEIGGMSIIGNRELPDRKSVV